MIRDARRDDAGLIADIYNHYVLNSTVTFEIEKLSISDMAGRITETQKQDLPYIVYIDDERRVIGYAYASKWKGRCAYRYSVEVSVYLHPEQSGQGMGTALYSALLHEKFGMKKVAHFKEIGFKFGQWVDVGYWQGFLSSPAQHN